MKDIEDRLSVYRPASPPHALRARVTATVVRERRRNPLLEWLPAAVAAGIALAFHLLGAGARTSADAHFAAAQNTRTALIDQLTASMGGDPVARHTAEEMVGSGLVPSPSQLLEQDATLVTNHE